MQMLCMRVGDENHVISCKAVVVLVSYSGDSVDVVYWIDRSIITFGDESVSDALG